MATPEEEKALQQVLMPLLKEWRTQHDDLLRKQQALADQIDQLEEKINSAAVLLGERPLASSTKSVSAKANEDAIFIDPFVSKIVSHIENSQRGLTPGQLRQLLLDDPETEAKLRDTHANYLYTLLARLVLKRTLVKEGPLYRLPGPQTNSAEEPTKEPSADMFG